MMKNNVGGLVGSGQPIAEIEMDPELEKELDFAAAEDGIIPVDSGLINQYSD